ncbi:glycosyltransferase family 4 protein [Thalassotalea aquiviva]|uniref:glycosyltransferase family 4 protein n=1 Tax=Thalassotalea aquiviva TaxID=3242415 RepID=UPI00352A1B30
MKSNKRLLIVTTVPLTLKSILAGQPKYLSNTFNVELATSPGPEMEDVATLEGLPIHQIKMERGISIIKDIKSLIKMIILLRSIKPDMVHSFTPKAGLITMLSSFLCRIPVRIHTFTGLIFPSKTGFQHKLLVLMDKLICACATKIVPEGEGVKKDLRKFGITKKTLKVIGKGNIAGVDTNFYDQGLVTGTKRQVLLKKQLNLPSDAFVFVFVGRFTEEKGIIELVNAFEKLPERAHLLLVGELDSRIPLPEHIQTTISQHRRIHDLGWKSDIRHALSLSNVLVLPSYREGFPNTPLQAGAMSLPSIVTDINGCNEIITQGVNGWLVPKQDTEQLALIMLESMHSNNLSLMGEDARKYIIDNFERKKHWQKMQLFYLEQV